MPEEVPMKEIQVTLDRRDAEELLRLIDEVQDRANPETAAIWHALETAIATALDE